MIQEQIYCDKVGHENQQISCICILPECQQQRTCCAFCIIDDHKDHVESIQKINDIKNQFSSQLEELQYLSEKKTGLLNQIDDAISFIEQNQNSQSNHSFDDIDSNRDFAKLETEIQNKLKLQTDLLRKESFESAQVVGYEQELYNRVLHSNNQDGKLWYKKGVSLYKARQYEDAVECFDKALQIKPKQYIFYSNKAACLNELKRYEEALLQVEKALKLNEQHALSWNEKGIALNYLNRKKESLECFRKSVAINRDHKRLCNLANQLEQFGLKLEALKYYKESLKKDSTYQKALNGVKRLQQQGFKI